MSNYNIDTPAIGRIKLSISQETISINDQEFSIYRGGARVLGVVFSVISDTENGAYVSMLKLIDDFSFSGYFASQ